MTTTRAPRRRVRAARRTTDATRRVLRRWRTATEAAEATAHRMLDADNTATGLADAVRTYTRAMERIPAEERVFVEFAGAAEALVDELSAHGVRFKAGRSQAAATVAASALAAWRLCATSVPPAAAAEWGLVFHLTVDGIRHALEHGGGLSDTARAMHDDAGRTPRQRKKATPQRRRTA